jgi:hypothetical protein
VQWLERRGTRRTVEGLARYSVAGSYITARLAPNRPMLHALVLGVLGLAVSIVGAAVTWNKALHYTMIFSAFTALLECYKQIRRLFRIGRNPATAASTMV